VTVTGNRFITAMSMAGSGWVILAGAGVYCPAAAALVAGHLREEGNSGDGDDFDALLAASSFGSEQAHAIREQTPSTAHEHARRVLDGQEKCTPADGDVDDAVGGLVYGLAHGVVPGPTVAILASSGLAPGDLLLSLSRRPPTDLKLVIFMACQTSMLWPDHRARLLQALIDHDAFASLRHDVAWKIIDWTFDVPRPPRVLRQCAELAVEQVDVSAIAYTWLASAQGEAERRSCQSYQSYLPRLSDGRAHLPEDYVEQEASPMHSGGLVPTKPALAPTPTRAALSAGSTGPAITVQADNATGALRHRRSSGRVRVRTRRLSPRPRTRRRPTSARKAARAAAPSARQLTVMATGIAAVIAAVIGLVLGTVRPDVVNALRPPGLVNGWQPPGTVNDLSPTDGSLAMALPSVLLFTSNSAALPPAADSILAPLAMLVRSEHLGISVTGYASPDGGTAAYNLALSYRRAAAVRDRLIALGVPATQIMRVTGVGTAGQPSNACRTDGKPDEATCALLRRVVILLSPAIGNR
jgi:outer membrane protein OmpA-like peptidoglycan-associated protein